MAMTNRIVVGLMVAMIVSPTLCYIPSDRQWFQTPTQVEDEDVFEMEDAEIKDEEMEDAEIEAGCGTVIYVMAFTTGVHGAGSDHSPHMTIELTTREVIDVDLYNRPGDDMYPNKGDLWHFTISLLGYMCITKYDIKEIIIHNGGSDGWNIESIVTILRSGSSYEVLTANMYVNCWVDSNQGDEELQYRLSLV